MNSTPLKVAVVIGSVRQGRFAEKPAQWIFEELKKRPNIQAALLDLRDYPLPFYDQAKTPSMVMDGNYGNDVANMWAKKIAEHDAFVLVSPEYNRSTSAVLKNALDWVYKEWNQKAIGYVAYGSVAGARAVEHLRQMAVEQQMAPVRAAVHIPGNIVFGGEWKPAENESLLRSANTMIEQLLWWGNALKAARMQGV